MHCLLALVLAWSAGDEEPGSGRGECTCAVAKKNHGWCDACGVGHVAGVKVPSAMLFEVLDVHGHRIDPERIKCKTCNEALGRDGFCRLHKMGFVRRQAYLSELAYHLARGEVKDSSQLACRTCRRNALAHGWCESCEVGRVGNLAIASREDLATVAAAFRRLRAAVETLERCERCAVATFTGGRCRLCKVSYRDGRPVAAGKSSKG